MSKSTRQKSSNPNYEVGYGRPPVATQFPPKTSGNPRGRPPKAKGLRKYDATDGLSAVQRAVLDAGAAKVEVRRGGRTVKMTQLEAAVDGLAEAARNGNVRAVQVFFEKHGEAEAEDRRQSVDDSASWELALRIAESLRAAKRDGPDFRGLTPPVVAIQGVDPEAGDQGRPSEAPQTPSDRLGGRGDTSSDGGCRSVYLSNLQPGPPADTRADSDAPSRSAPSGQVQTIMCSAPAAMAVRRRTTDPLIPDRRPIKAGSWGVSG
jgi:hypothetical protein